MLNLFLFKKARSMLLAFYVSFFKNAIYRQIKHCCTLSPGTVVYIAL